MSVPVDELLERDCQAFLGEVRDLLGAEKHDAYARVLFALTAWSLARDLEFRAKVPASSGAQATVSFYVRGGPLFWEVYPRKTRKDAKFCCLSSIDPRVPADPKAQLVRAFADLSPGKEADSPSVPTLSFDTLAAVGTCAALLRLLEDALRRVPAD
jgi:hypothetical protein